MTLVCTNQWTSTCLIHIVKMYGPLALLHMDITWLRQLKGLINKIGQSEALLMSFQCTQVLHWVKFIQTILYHYTVTTLIKTTQQNPAQIENNFLCSPKISHKVLIWASCTLQNQQFCNHYCLACKCHWSICNKFAWVALGGAVTL